MDKDAVYKSHNQETLVIKIILKDFRRIMYEAMFQCLLENIFFLDFFSFFFY